MNLFKSASLVAIGVVLATGLVSCSLLSPQSEPARSAGPLSHGAAPQFNGPWAAEFAEAYQSATDELVHQILAKESITDGDYAAVAGEFVKCMANKGFAVEIDGPAGEMTISNAPSDGDIDRANAASNACDSGWGRLCALRGQLLRNPMHLDENEIMAACLVRSKIAPPSYTASDYTRDLETWTFPYSISSIEFGNCISNPLDLEGKR